MIIINLRNHLYNIISETVYSLITYVQSQYYQIKINTVLNLINIQALFHFIATVPTYRQFTYYSLTLELAKLSK